MVTRYAALEPTYEGLKRAVARCNSDPGRPLEPTYEGLKQSHLPG